MKKTIIIISIISIGISSIIIFKFHTISNGNTYRPSGNEYFHLNETSVVEKGGFSYFGKSKKLIKGGNIILHLSGSPYEMGFQHGILLKKEINQGVVDDFANPLRNVDGYNDLPEIIIWFVMKYLEFTVYAPLEDNIPLEYLQEIKGIADGAGLDFRTVFFANFLSDMMMVMIKDDFSGKFKVSHGVLSCSEFAVANEATIDGKLIIGRNTDYSGQGRWMKNQTIFIYRPKDGHSYVNVGTAGIIKCNAGMNDKGITVGGHFMAFDNATADGVSFAILENEIMRKASCLDEAVAIIRSNKIAGSWGLFIADGNTRKAIAVEANSEIIAVRHMENDSIYQTNYALSSDMMNHDIFRKNNMFMRDIGGRYRDLGLLISKNYGNIAPEIAAAFLGNHYDFVLNKERSFGYSIGAITTVTSVVFSPENRTFWVATGKEPAWNNEYIGYNLLNELGNHKTNVNPKKLAGYQWVNEGNRMALEKYMKAIIDFSVNNRKASIATYLENAIKDAPDEPVYYFQLAKIYISDRNYKKAEKLLLHSSAIPQWNNEKAIAFLLLGNIYDLLKLRSKAVSYYDKVIMLHNKNGTDFINGVNKLLYIRANDYKKNPFDNDRIDDISMSLDLSSGVE